MSNRYGNSTSKKHLPPSGRILLQFKRFLMGKVDSCLCLSVVVVFSLEMFQMIRAFDATIENIWLQRAGTSTFWYPSVRQNEPTLRNKTAYPEDKIALGSLLSMFYVFSNDSHCFISVLVPVLQSRFASQSTGKLLDYLTILRLLKIQKTSEKSKGKSKRINMKRSMMQPMMYAWSGRTV